jgi:dipeptidyl aminopeptidase/acylaminoacyl peptidase
MHLNDAAGLTAKVQSPNIGAVAEIGEIPMKKWLKIGLGLILAVVVVFVGISGYLGYSMTRVERVPLEGNPGLMGLTYQDVSFPSMDKELTLRGWFLPNPDSKQVIVMVHGNGYNRVDPTIGTLDIASRLVGHGYNVLMFDLRGYGESDGNTVSGGYYEKRDLEGAVNYLKERGFEHIGVLGFSLGAVTSLLAGAEDRDIEAIVSDSSFADLKDIMEPEFSKRTHAPQFFLHPILFMIKIMYRVDFTAIRPVDSVAKIAPRPVLFIHGEADETIPVAHAYRLLQASQNSQNELWVVPEAGHTRSYKAQPEEYVNRVTGFFDMALR